MRGHLKEGLSVYLHLRGLYGFRGRRVVGIAAALPGIAGPFASAEEFIERATTVIKVEMRVYGVDDDLRAPEILLPERYAQVLDPIREFRRRLSGVAEGPVPAIQPELLRRALPEDFVPLLDAAPDIDFINHLLILDEQNPYNPWFRQLVGDPGFISAASANPGSMMFFARDQGATLHDEFMYAWSHCFRYERDDDVRFFAIAAELESAGGYCHRQRALENVDENWALHLGECVLGKDDDAFQRFTEGAPLRAAVLGVALRPFFELRRSVATEPWLDADAIAHWLAVAERVDHLNAVVRDRALGFLADCAEREGEHQRIVDLHRHLKRANDGDSTGWFRDRLHLDLTRLDVAVDTSVALEKGAMPVEVGMPGRSQRLYFFPGGGKTEWFKDHDTGPEMVVVPAGSFVMGASTLEIAVLEQEPGGSWIESEVPQRSVTIKSAFAIGRFPVTFAEWDACVADGGCNGYQPDDRGWGRGTRPVINVSWRDAKLYISWLNGKTGRCYRLPSEAEREYVTRAGTTTPFWWGGAITSKQANYHSLLTYDGGAKGETRQQTLPVESFEANPWGLYQVHGNVNEWCEDVWYENYNGAPIDGTAWHQDGVAIVRVYRGGSWSNSPQSLRAASRNRCGSGARINSLGFRLARSLYS
jgi:formylglycine-generating enzyme required for sulfatase activity